MGDVIHIHCRFKMFIYCEKCWHDRKSLKEVIHLFHLGYFEHFVVHKVFLAFPCGQNILHIAYEVEGQKRSVYV